MKKSTVYTIVTVFFVLLAIVALASCGRGDTGLAPVPLGAIRPLVWTDANGCQYLEFEYEGIYVTPRLGPDGKQICRQ